VQREAFLPADPGEHLERAFSCLFVRRPAVVTGDDVADLFGEPFGVPAHADDRPGLLLVCDLRWIVLPVAHGAAIGCNGVPLEAGTAAVAWIVCGHDPPVFRRIPARLVDHVDVIVPLWEEGTGAGRERLLRRGWVLPSVGVGHVALGLLVPLPGSPRVGVPREEDRVKV